MARNFRTLYDRMPEESRRRVEERVQESMKELALDELRVAREITQESLAKKLHTDQGAVSKLERRTDMYLSTLDRTVSAMGGRLELRAVFPSGEAHLLRIAKPRAARRKRRAR
ncbi:MAG TPA: XRE family transcriptional regulator [Candidatus Acidoferrales bacterium]